MRNWRCYAVMKCWDVLDYRMFRGRCLPAFGAALVVAACSFVPATVDAWVGEVVLQADRTTVQPGAQVEISIFAKITLETDEQVVGIAQYELVWELERLTLESNTQDNVRVGRLLYRDANIEASKDGNNALFENCPRTSASFLVHPVFGPLERPLATVKPGDTDPSCLLGPFETLVLSVDGPAGAAAGLTIVPNRVSLISRILSVANSTLTKGPALKYSTGGNSNGAFAPGAFGDPISFTVVEPGQEVALALSVGADGEIVVGRDEANPSHILNVTLADGGSDSFPGPTVTGFTVDTDQSVVGLQFILRDGATDLATAAGTADGLSFQGLSQDLADGESKEYSIHVYGAGGSLTNGAAISFSLVSSASHVVTADGTTITSLFTGQPSATDVPVQIMATGIMLVGSATWDLSGPYDLAASVGQDAYGNTDANFDIASAVVEASVGGGSFSVVSLVGGGVPVTVYTDQADRDGMAVDLRARAGIGSTATFTVSVDVVADTISLASPADGNAIDHGAETLITGFRLEALGNGVIDTDIDNAVTLECVTDSNVVSCDIASDASTFTAGVYAADVANVRLTATLGDIIVPGQISTLSAFVVDLDRVVNLLSSPLAVIGCTGEGLTLASGATDEESFMVTVGGALCDGTVNYTIYYAPRIAASCPVAANEIISDGEMQSMQFDLSANNATATFTAGVDPDTVYCVVAQVTGLDQFSTIIEADTTVEATMVSLSGAPTWNLSDSYALSGVGTDNDGRADSDFGLTSPNVTVEARVGGGSFIAVTLEENDRVPVEAYTEQTDSDGMIFELRARIGAVTPNLDTLQVSVDVVADAVVIASQADASALVEGAETPITGFRLEARGNGVIDTDIYNDVTLECIGDSNVASCNISTDTNTFAAGVYAADVVNVRLTATLIDVNAPGQISTLTATVSGFGSFDLLSSPLSLIGCSGDGLTLTASAIDEESFMVTVGGALCQGTASYTVYYAPRSGDSCPVDADMIVGDDAVQSQPFNLSTAAAAATVTAGVVRDTMYCVVARVSGLAGNSDVAEVDTTVEATMVELSGAPDWDLSAPYMLSVIGTDDDGRLDSNFNLSTVQVSVGGGDYDTVLLVNGGVPVTAYTNLADSDGMAFALRARVGDTGSNSNILMVSVSVSVDDFLLEMPSDVDTLASGVETTYTAFRVEARGNGVLATGVNHMVTPSCSGDANIESCNVRVVGASAFDAGVYSADMANILITATLVNIIVTGTISIDTLVNGDDTVLFPMPLQVTGCNGEDLILTSGAADESSFVVEVGGELCQSTVSYTIYYAPRSGASCPADAAADDVVNAAGVQSQQFDLSAAAATAMVTAGVAPDTVYCVVARVSGLAENSNVAEADTTVEATMLELSGVPDWDLSGPYALSIIGSDDDGRLDSNFDLGSATVEASVGGGDYAPVTLDANGNVPVTAYTAQTDGVAFDLIARIENGPNSTSLIVTVNVDADTLIVASPVDDVTLLNGMLTPITGFRLEARGNSVIDADADDAVTLTCDDSDPAVASCNINVGVNIGFDAGVYTAERANLRVTANLVAITAPGNIPALTASVSGFTSVDLLSSPLAVIGCTGVGLMLATSGRSDESFFDVNLSDGFCDGTASYTIYYAPRSGASCPTANDIVAGGESEEFPLSADNATATVTTNVGRDTNYCVVARVTGTDVNSNIVEVNTMVEATVVELGGAPTWDLSDSYVLSAVGRDGDGRLDSNFTTTATGIAVEASVDGVNFAAVTLDANGNVPVAAYTARTDGVAFVLRVQIGGTVASNIHQVMVDVVADTLIVANPVSNDGFVHDSATLITGFRLEAQAGANGVIDTGINSTVTLTCSTDPNVADCALSPETGVFAAGVYEAGAANIMLTATLADVVTLGEITALTATVAGFGSVELLSSPLAVTGCTGEGLALTASAIDEQSFMVVVGGTLCDGIASYTIYYAPRIGDSCPVDADDIVNAAGVVQSQSFNLSAGDATATVTADVVRDTNYCVVARVSGVSDQSSNIAEVNTIVEATVVELTGAPDWDLSGPYVLSAVGRDGDGRLDSNLTTTATGIIVEASVDGVNFVAVTLDANGNVPVSAYTDQADRDGVAFELRARIGDGGPNSTILSVMVDVVADTLIVANPVSNDGFVHDRATLITGFRLEAQAANGVIDTGINSAVTLTCGTDLNVAGCALSPETGVFTAGVYEAGAANIMLTAMLADVVTPGQISTLTATVAGFGSVELLSAPLAVTGCTGEGLALTASAIDEQSFMVVVGGTLCQGTASYTIYYAPRVGDSCPVDADDIVNAAGVVQSQSFNLSAGDATATVTADVVRDTNYCVVARVSGVSDQSSNIAEVNTIVEATVVELTGAPDWDLSGPYVLSAVGRDGDGRLDSNFTTTATGIIVEASVDGVNFAAVTLDGNGNVPVAAYTDQTDRDGVAFMLRVQIGGATASNILSVTVDVVATALVADGEDDVQLGSDGMSIVVTQAVKAVDTNGIVDSGYSGIVVLDSSASTSGTVTARVSTNAAGVEDLADGRGVAVIVVSVEDPGTSPPTVTLSLTAESGGTRLMPFDLQFEFQVAFNLDFDGDGSLAGVADFALLFFWETDRRSYQSERNGGASHEAALRAALQPSVDLGLLNDQNVLVGGEKLLAVLPPTPVLAALLDFDGDNSLAGVADFALLFFWETDRRSYQSERNGGASHEAALRAALQPSVDLGLLNDQNVLVGGEKLLRVLHPTYQPPAPTGP